MKMLGDHVLQLTLVPFRINLREAELLQSGWPCDLGRLRNSASIAETRFAVDRLTPSSRARLATVR